MDAGLVDAADARLDHVALNVADRDATADELVERFDLRVIERTDRFTLLGADADHGKVTLLDAEGGRATRPDRIVSLVLAAGTAGSVPPPVTLRNGLVVTFAGTDELGPEWEQLPRHALVGVSLRASDPPIAAAQLETEHGMHVGAVSPEHAVLDVGDDQREGRITLSRERWSTDAGGQSMLDHIGIRVPDAHAWRLHAERSDVDVVRWVEAPHSRAVFVSGPEGLLLEYVELTRPFDD